MYHTELQGRDVGCVWMLGVGADRLLDRTLLSAPRLPAAGSAPRRPGAPCLSHAKQNASSSNTKSNGFCSCSCAGPQPQGMDICKSFCLFKDTSDQSNTFKGEVKSPCV